jgi:hypothetical protein
MGSLRLDFKKRPSTALATANRYQVRVSGSIPVRSDLRAMGSSPQKRAVVRASESPTRQFPVIAGIKRSGLAGLETQFVSGGQLT